MQTSLSEQAAQVGHCDIITTKAASQGLISLTVSCLRDHSMRELHDAEMPFSVHMSEQPVAPSGCAFTAVVDALVILADANVVESLRRTPLASSDKATIVVAMVDVLLTVETFVTSRATVVEEVAVGAAVEDVGVEDVGVFVVEVCVQLAVVVAVLVSVVVSVRVTDDVDDFVEVLVSVVEVLVRVLGQPRPSYLQHQAFQSGVQAISQISYSALQS